ncbi:enoyl-CoA hydratase-related protein [Paenibacillus thiaminolyticus]|uniref:enoyl-CoA hydratase-related protein n=1 Tax=Paenibacillus thiaminolyticus TaxID=49283 RepID=UPI0035A678E9
MEQQELRQRQVPAQDQGQVPVQDQEQVPVQELKAEQSVRLEHHGQVAIITLNRPGELNAFNYEALVRLGGIVEEIRQDRQRIRAVIVTGTGRAFSAGADLKERRTLNEQQVRRNVRAIREVFTAVEELPQPTIAAVNGYAFGGGFELTLACDFRFAVRDARMGLPEVSLGIIPGAGGTQRLPRLIGPAKAKELVLTARKISAEEALQYGLLSGIADDSEQLRRIAFELAKEIAANAPLAVYQAKYAMNRGSSVDLHSGLEVEAQAYEMIIPTKDRAEALAAFADKRKPDFRGE